MGQEAGIVRVSWTRAELIALQEAIEVTPNFDRRQEAREMLAVAVQSPRIVRLELEAALAETLAGRLVPADFTTANARAKLLRAIKNATVGAQPSLRLPVTEAMEPATAPRRSRPPTPRRGLATHPLARPQRPLPQSPGE